MKDDDFIDFLQWALPRLDKRWSGFRKPRGQVKKRVKSRLEELGLSSLDAYRQRLEREPEEWEVLDEMARVTISQFYRNRGTWDFLRDVVLDELIAQARAADRDVLRAWSAGCASGEEPYTLRIMWDLGFSDSGLGLEIAASDLDPHMVDRARRARYPETSVRDMPVDWVAQAFDREDNEVILRERFREVEYRVEDVTESMPDGPFDLVFCAYTVFIYYEEHVGQHFLERLSHRVVPGAALVVGAHESPPDSPHLQRWDESGDVYRFSG